MSFKKISDIELSKFKNDLPIPEVETPDYAQNDPTAKDYIKNRPGGYDETVTEVLIDEQTVTTEGVESPYVELNGALSLEEGKTYIVNFDGTLYECVAYSDDVYDNNAVCIGNGSIIGASGGNDEPFAFDSYNDGSIYLDTPSVETHTVSISDYVTKSVQFDDKYIPDTISRKAELDARITEKEAILASSTDGSSKKFKITVDDSGAITATEITDTTSSDSK